MIVMNYFEAFHRKELTSKLAGLRLVSPKATPATARATHISILSSTPPDTGINFPHSIYHIGKVKLKAGSEQSGGHYAATLEDQLCLGPVDECCHFEHCACRVHAEGHSSFV